MQKVIRRARLARNQAERQAKADREVKDRGERIRRDDTRRGLRAEWKVLQAREQHRRIEDWKLGPLSPWRTNMQNMLADGFGSVSTKLQQTMVEDAVIDKLKKKAGALLLREGDRVVVVRGHESVRGQIGTITRWEEDTGEFTIASLNKIDSYPSDGMEFFQPKGQEHTVQSINRRFHPDDLRLVYPLPNPETGIPEDCALEKLVAKNYRFHRFQNKLVWERWLEPQGIRIPWPPEEQPVHTDEVGDTLRIDLETVSYLPRLLTPPMPNTVMDELRNKYSKMRIRHTDEYIAEKTAEDEAEALQEARVEALRPRGARNIARAGRGSAHTDSDAADGPEKRIELSDELAAAIGAHMEASRAQHGAAQGAGAPS